MSGAPTRGGADAGAPGKDENAGASFAEADRIAELTLDDAGGAPTPEIDQERKVAVFELLENNRFRPAKAAGTGPFAVTLGLAERRIAIRATDAAGGETAGHVPLSALDALISDYLAICDSYYDAVRRLPPSQIELLDQTRRELHAEAADALKGRMAPEMAVDHETARRLFTVICALVGPVRSGV